MKRTDRVKNCERYLEELRDRVRREEKRLGDLIELYLDMSLCPFCENDNLICEADEHYCEECHSRYRLDDDIVVRVKANG